APAEMAVWSKCAECGAHLSSAFSYCPQCGASRTGARCLHCGGKIIPEWPRCPSCGHRPDSFINRPSAARETAQPAKSSASGEHNARGMELYNEEKYDDAIAEFETALEMD